MKNIVKKALRTVKRFAIKILEMKACYISYPIVSKSFKFKILSNEKTIERIVSERLSVSRYGDGEIMLMNNRSIGFQKANPNLARRLKEIINARDAGHMVCLTDCILSTDELREEPAKYCRIFTVANAGLIKSLVPPDRVYGCTNFTRFYADWKDKSEEVMRDRINRILTIWEGGTMYTLLKVNILAVV